MNILKVMQNVIDYQDLEHRKFEAFTGELIYLMVRKYGPLVELICNTSNPRVLAFNLSDHSVLFAIRLKIYSPILSNPLVEAIYGNNITIKLVLELKSEIVDLGNSLIISKNYIENQQKFHQSENIRIRCHANSIFGMKEISYNMEDILNNPWEERKKLEQEIEDQIKIISEQLEQFKKNLLTL